MLGPFDIPKPWSLAEETMLLDAVEQYGFGNWHDVANHVESRTAPECQDHYVSFYLFGNIGKVSVPCCNYSFGLTNDDSVPNHKKTLNNATNNNDDSESVLMNHQKPLNNATNNDEHDWGVTTPVKNNHIEQPDLGYVLFRDDYEYDNDAESLISSLSVELDDEDIDIAFKLTQVDNYRLRLQEREQRKRVAHDYGLFHYSGGNKFKSPNSKRKTTKIDREFQEKLRVFAQFNTFQEHVQYYETLARERDLQNRIRELFRFRKNGLMTLAEVVVFKNRKYKRDRRKKMKNQPPIAGKKGVNGFRRNKRKRKKIRFTNKRTRYTSMSQQGSKRQHFADLFRAGINIK